MAADEPIQPSEETSSATSPVIATTAEPAGATITSSAPNPDATSNPPVQVTQEGMNDAIMDAEQSHTLESHPSTASVTASKTAINTSQPDTSEDAQAQGTANGYRPLNVKDALTYLDQVKTKFADSPGVYNQFLDIMKEFKSQNIDTPGVIERVSSLFRGHISLITGFSTFLPPGYCIDCTSDDEGRSVIQVTTPSGHTSTVTTDKFGPLDDDKSLPTSAPSGPSDTSPVSRRPQIEFNHAISYVNKIKNRFSDDPETYKKFLEILQTYQKEQRPIQQVYTQVRGLFSGQEDLLGEFKQFLPDPSSNQPLPFVGPNEYVQSRKKRSAPVGGMLAKRSRLNPKFKAESSAVRSSASLSDETILPLISAEEHEFFDRVKKYINNEDTYNAFFKELKLFTKQTVDPNALVSRVEEFIGGNLTLFNWFKTLVGYDGKDAIVENVPVEGRIGLKRDGIGPSYRVVPTSKRRAHCSGRDAMCWKVLNDTYISQPTWPSEDNECVTAKKNKYEESLHRVEEERYDYDLNIEANLSAIALLEPIAKKVAGMTTEEKLAFKLPPGLGGPSKTIYQRIIKKIYGPEKGLEIIELLHSNPSRTVPIVLKRLKQKDEEWKSAQREWNKIWREVESKSYYKSLDYMGITFRASDRKLLTMRALIDEIEQIKEQQQQHQTLSTVTERRGPQLSYDMSDIDVCKDICYLARFFAERQQLYQPDEIEAILRFLDDFAPIAFRLNDEPPPNHQVKHEDQESQVTTGGDADDEQEEHDGEEEEEDDGDNGDDEDYQEDEDHHSYKEHALKKEKETKPSATTSPQSMAIDYEEQQSSGGDIKTKENNTLLAVDVVPSETKAIDGNNQPEHTDHGGQTASLDGEAMSVDITQPSSPTAEPNNDRERRILHFIGNDEFYCFYRLFQTVYGRLLRMKKLDKEYAQDADKAKSANKAALEVGQKTKYIDDVCMDFKNGYYKALLDLILKLFDGDIEPQLFEDCTRYIFGTNAYIMFTIDRVILSLLRCIQRLSTDASTTPLIDLFKKYREMNRIDAQLLADYRLQATPLVNEDDHVFHMGFDTLNRVLTIRLLGSEDWTSQDACLYDAYISDYFANWDSETPGIRRDKMVPSFLKRNLERRPDEKRPVLVISRLLHKICKDSFQMFYMIGTHDTFLRQRQNDEGEAAFNAGSAERWKAWLESSEGWSRGVDDRGEAESAARKLYNDNQS